MVGKKTNTKKTLNKLFRAVRQTKRTASSLLESRKKKRTKRKQLCKKVRVRKSLQAVAFVPGWSWFGSNHWRCLNGCSRLGWDNRSLHWFPKVELDWRGQLKLGLKKTCDFFYYMDIWTAVICHHKKKTRHIYARWFRPWVTRAYLWFKFITCNIQILMISRATCTGKWKKNHNNTQMFMYRAANPSEDFSVIKSHFKCNI